MFKEGNSKMTKNADKILMLDAKLVNTIQGNKNTTLGVIFSIR